MYGLRSVNVTRKSRRCGKGSGMIRGRRKQFGLLEWVSSLTSGCVYSMEVWWCGVMGILLSVGFLEMVPAVSNRGVCFGTPTAILLY